MYNLRYHVASLVAVFLALAVGLLLGTLVAERGMITEQSSALVAELQQRFDEINATNEELRAGLERDRAFAADASEAIVDGKLEGARVVVLVGTGRADGVSAVEQVIAEAGGSTEVASLATVALGLDTTEPEGLAGYLHARDIEMAEPGPELQQQVATALVAEWYAGEGRELTQLLVDAGLIEVPESLAGTATVSAVVVMAGGADGADPFALALGQAMAGAGGTAVGVEAVASDTGVAAACASQGLSAVGHVATPQGRVSLVWVLSGAARGYFGPAEDADGYYPPLLIEE